MSDDNIQPTGDEPIDTIDDELDLETPDSDDEFNNEPEVSETVDHDFDNEPEVSDLEDEVFDIASELAELDGVNTREPEPQSANEMEIDAALAAVSQLSLLAEEAEDDEIFDDQAETDIEDTSLDAEYQPVEPEPELDDPTPYSDFELPRSLTMSRGQLSSVIPAVALIAVGGWLTFTLTTSTVPPSNGLLLAIGLITVGAVFLAQWLNSSRWSRGNFFFGTATLLIGGVQLYLSQVAPAAVTSGWTLWVVAIGIALFGAGYITLPRLPRLSIMGVLMIVAGGIGYLLTSGTIDPTVINFISNLWFIGVAIVIFMIVAPLVRRRS